MIVGTTAKDSMDMIESKLPTRSGIITSRTRYNATGITNAFNKLIILDLTLAKFIIRSPLSLKS